MNNKKVTYLENKTGGVHLYRTGAYLERECVTEVPLGVSELIFDGLSSDTDCDRVYVETDDGIQVLSQTVETSQAGEDKYRDLKRKLAQAKNELRLLETDVRMTDSEIDLLNANRNISCNGDRNQIEDFAKYYMGRLRELLARRASREEALEESRAEVRRLQAEANVAEERKAKRVVVTVRAAEEKMADVLLRYFVPTACWAPRYEIRSDGEGTPLEITLKAAVKNESGENWQDARLTFSTGMPLRRQSVPEFVPEYVPAPRPRLMARAMAFNAAPAAEEAAFESVQVNEAETERVFATKGLYDVPHGAGDMSVALETITAAADYGYTCVSCMAQSVFFTATAQVALPVANAEAAMFLRGRFCGSDYLEAETEGKIACCFGLDGGIVVRREQLSDYTSKKLGGAEKTDKCYIVTLKNNKPMPVRVTVVDRIPVSVNKAVGVEAALSDGAQLEKAKGKVVWNVELPAGAVKVLKAEYTVVAQKTDK